MAADQRHLAALVLSGAVLVALVPLAACKRDEKPEATRAATSASAANPYAIDEDDVPTSVDFEQDALQAITPENVEAEVAKMEKELE